MKRYSPKEIEQRWQRVWSDTKLYAAKDFDESRRKFVMLTEFPYPSGDGLHLGHVREYTLGDIIARYKRMQGMNVLYPMGYDAFGLPTENFAIKNKIAPQVATDQNVATFQKQFDSLGYSIDWERSFRTTDPDYYRWTQWLFLRFFKAGLAYQDEIAINWCPHCKTGLANEEVIGGRHERCGTPVEKKLLKQWLLKITDYADRLIDGLQNVDYPSRIADQQVNWIGRSRGAEIDFALDGHKEKIRVFTTRPDTLFGATYMVLAPEHPLVSKIVTAEQKAEVEKYIKHTVGRSEVDRQDEDREKTGVFTGTYAVNPANKKKIPIWIADFVLMGYGTGAVFGDAHDERDVEFANKFGIDLIPTINPVTIRDDVKDLTDFKQKRKIVALVENDKGEILTLDWGPKLGGRLLIGGTIEGRESPEKTAAREITEETGYTDLELIAVGDETFYYKYYAFSKQEAHEAEVKFVHFRLKSDSQRKQKLDKEEDFKVEWVSREIAEREITEPLHRYAFDKFILHKAYTGEGILFNSGKYDGQTTFEARENIVADLVKKGVAKEKINYRLRDWIFSRQHYWGEPIPIIHCPEHGAVAVPDDQLPVELPPVEHYEPTDTGESPLATVDQWVNTKCPKCGQAAKRETDTMPNWAGSSWYYLRYFDAKNKHAFADRKKLEYWGMVDLYLGGMEHTTLHLLYSRFWHQFFYDQGLVPTPEPYAARRGQGIVLATDNTKMSKSKGNIVNPSEIIDQGYGADALRLAISFLAPYDMTTPWNSNGVAGTYRFINRIWNLTHEWLAGKDKKAEQAGSPGAPLARVIQKATRLVTDDLEQMGFNTAIATLMEAVNELYKLKSDIPFSDPEWRTTVETLLRLVAPFAPHITEELWEQIGHDGSIHVSSWPGWDAKLLKDDMVTIVVQVNGKVRDQLLLPADADEATVIAEAKTRPKVDARIAGKTPKKTIYVPGKLINFVV